MGFWIGKRNLRSISQIRAVLRNKEVLAENNEDVFFNRATVQALIPKETKNANEFLPPGWMNIHGSGSGAIWGTQETDPKKFKFMNSLLASRGGYPYRVIQWYKGRRIYSAFVTFGSVSGKEVALVETDKENNALYVFRACLPNWQTVAYLSKEQFRPGGSYRNCSEFVCKMYHGKNFKQKVLKKLSIL